MKYALVNLADATLLRTADFDGDAPALPPEKGLAWLIYIDTPRPEFDPVTQGLREAPFLVEQFHVTRQWEVFPLPDEDVAEAAAAAEAARIASLWQAAHDLEFSAISGSAIGLVTLGVLQGKPKCLAVMAWIQAIWASYYERKAGGSADTDFAAAGACPHSVPDLMIELGL